MSQSLDGSLEQVRRELLDLSGRNRLLNTPRSETRNTRVEIVDEVADQVFRHLVLDGKTMTFLATDESGASSEASDWEVGIDQPNGSTTAGAKGDDAEGKGSESGPSAAGDVVSPGKHTDSRLQTKLDTDKLEKKLLTLQRKAKTELEEQGVSTLFLALGFLVWREDDRASSKERHAPLVLLPVELTRETVRSKFRLSFGRDEISTNLSLQERLRADFGVDLPDLPESTEDLLPSEYAAQVAAAVESFPNWRVQANDMLLWEFYFAKIRMYKDLQSEAWPEGGGLDGEGLVNSMLVEGFADELPVKFSNDEPIDRRMAVQETFHIVDADSSQAMVIDECRSGRNLVVQGPPGTGKSQTIANMIAASVKEGKSVLFVAEKLAALEVVHRRLNQVGLSDACLELHSNKASKKEVIAELDRTLKLGVPRLRDPEHVASELERCRAKLNSFSEAMSAPVGQSGHTPYSLVGEITRLRATGVRSTQLDPRAARRWPRKTIDGVIHRARELRPLAESVGDPTTNPWRGVQIENVLPTDVDRIGDTIGRIVDRLDAILQASEELAGALNALPPSTGASLSMLAQTARKLAQAPPSSRRLLAEPVWRERLEEIASLVEDGRQYERLTEEVVQAIDSQQLDADVRDAYDAIKAHGSSWLRVFSSAYRKAVTKVRVVSAGPPPSANTDRLALLKSLLEHQDARAALETDENEQIGKTAFGETWSGRDTKWEAAQQLVETVRSGIALAETLDAPRETVAAIDPAAVQSAILPIANHLKACFAELNTLCADLSWPLAEQLGAQNLTTADLGFLRERFQACRNNPAGLRDYANLQSRCLQLEKAGLGEPIAALQRGELDPSLVADSVELSLYETLMRAVYEENPSIAGFDGAGHEELRQAFSNLDKQWIETTRAIVAKAHWDGVPRGESFGEMSVITREAAKKTRHMPIRKLIANAGRAMQRIKPVFMMSPLSVAQYLPPGEMHFDLLLIDEASQVKPEDAIGALARADQVVVVGDSKQLPPTAFFSRSADGEEEAEEYGENSTKDVESVLGLCCSRGMPERMLRWHYRSEHHSLIAYSNHDFYNSQLRVVPSPTSADEEVGLELRHLPKTAYDRGGSRVNRGEAEAVAKAVMRHAKQNRRQTLGVGAFSVAQRDAILDEVEARRRKDTSCEHFFSEGAGEPFFVKNLENIQGDERDVIFISVGYGRDADGYLPMSFGPLNNDGGERRLNVLITRARKRCVIFSNITADDIDLARTQARGVVSLKGYLRYAQLGLLDTDTPPEDREYDSEFERQVADALRKHGIETHAQVGVAGFRIDLAVADPKQPGRYLLGIECDGATYHSSRSARDRDRIRQGVLESRGWTIHRIWSLDWFNDPQSELQRVLEAIEATKGYELDENESPPVSPPPLSEPNQAIQREESADQRHDSAGSAYVVADFPPPCHSELLESETDRVMDAVSQIVSLEGPIHHTELIRRVTHIWGLRRTGSRITQRVTEVLGYGVDRAILTHDGDFVSAPGVTVRVRDRSGAPASVRKADVIPTAEIELAIMESIAAHVGVGRNEIARAAANRMGIKTVTAVMSERILGVLDEMIAESQVADQNGRLQVAT